MKRFGNYQYVGGPMTERERLESQSKFWNKGKWDNFVKPFLPEDVSELSMVDVGCNAGLFLKLAEDAGFKEIIGVESNKEAFDKAIAFKEGCGGNYGLHRMNMESSLSKLAVVDFTILANVHYYLAMDDWLNYLDTLIKKTRYCVVVTAEKGRWEDRIHKASADIPNIVDYFRFWELQGIIDNVSPEGDPYPRNVYAACFKSPIMERVKIKDIECANTEQTSFYQELDRGIKPDRTKYAKHLRETTRRKKWSGDRFSKYMEGKASLYESIKYWGIFDAIVINKDNKVTEGRHRFGIAKHLEYDSIIVRRVL